MMQRRFTENSGQLPDPNPTSMVKSASVSTQASGYYLLVLYPVAICLHMERFLVRLLSKVDFIDFPTVIGQSSMDQ